VVAVSLDNNMGEIWHQRQGNGCRFDGWRCIYNGRWRGSGEGNQRGRERRRLRFRRGGLAGWSEENKEGSHPQNAGN